MNHRNTIYLSEGPYRAETPYQSEGAYRTESPYRAVGSFPASLTNNPQRDVPWAGATQEWQRGAIVPPPAPMKTQPDQVAGKDWMREMELSSDELQTVYSSFVLSPAHGSGRSGWFRGALVGLMIGGASVGLGMYFHPGAQTTVESESRENLPVGRAGANDNQQDISRATDVDGSAADTVQQVASLQKPQAKSAIGVQRKTRSTASPVNRSRGAAAPEAGANADEANQVPLTSTGQDSVPLTGESKVAAAAAPGLLNDPPTDAAAETPQDQSAMGVAMTESLAESTASNAATTVPAPTPAISELNNLLKSTSTPVTSESKSTPGDGFPDRDAIRMAMEHIAPQVGKCKSAESGKVVVQMVVSGDTGRVISSRVIDDTFRGTATGVCAARAVRSVKLPSFERDKVVIKYPFAI